MVFDRVNGMIHQRNLRSAGLEERVPNGVYLANSTFDPSLDGSTVGVVVVTRTGFVGPDDLFEYIRTNLDSLEAYIYQDPMFYEFGQGQPPEILSLDRRVYGRIKTANIHLRKHLEGILESPLRSDGLYLDTAPREFLVARYGVLPAQLCDSISNVGKVYEALDATGSQGHIMFLLKIK